ncbi:abscisic acid 8'-hydroxylase 2-like [Lotus japonicus]|uniref:abscisic acid 8'-hydroxylase 2-like n=1 Tax=Lotus japonicus TaxID=34305 RepID=UPI00258E63F9|nr:abscisic acid 8'-hydroxylase 2-like [Lotus japonicus]
MGSQSLQEEQQGIRNKLAIENRGLTWDDTRQMSLSGRVIQETLRCASIVSFTFREAVQDVELEGYFIPKGWKVLPLLRSIHHSADFFPHQQTFDPSRFEEKSQEIQTISNEKGYKC